MDAPATSSPAEKDNLNRMLSNDTGDLHLWWVRPLNQKWSKYGFYEIKGDAKGKIIRWFRDSKFERPEGGDYWLLDLQFEQSDKTGQGFFVFDRKGERLGFKFKAIMVNKQAVQECAITRFDSEKRLFEFKQPTDVMGGLILGGKFRPLLDSYRR
ncbi:MAG: hypothetical protein QM755_06095 [Luteolibacter sp.]